MVAQPQNLHRRRLELQCRSRSCLEADLLFSKARDKVWEFSAAELKELEALLQLEDAELMKRIATNDPPPISAKSGSVFRLLVSRRRH